MIKAWFTKNDNISETEYSTYTFNVSIKSPDSFGGNCVSDVLFRA